MRSVFTLLALSALFGQFFSSSPCLAEDNEFVAANPSKDKSLFEEIAKSNEQSADSAPLILTEEQLSKWIELKDNFEVSVSGKKAELESLNHKISDRMTDPISSDRKDLEQLQERLLTLCQEISRARFQFSLKVMEELSADQRRKLKGLLLSAMTDESHIPNPMLPPDRASFIGFMPTFGNAGMPPLMMPSMKQKGLPPRPPFGMMPFMPPMGPPPPFFPPPAPPPFQAHPPFHEHPPAADEPTTKSKK